VSTRTPPTGADVARRAATLAEVDEITGWTQPPGSAPYFYLGSHRAPWVATSPAALFTCVKHFNRYVDTSNENRVPKSVIPGAWDSGGFTELADHGDWRWDLDDFGGMVYRLIDDIGRPTFVASMDFMCEPPVIMGGTFKGRTFVGTAWGRKYGFEAAVRLHQEWTVSYYRYLTQEFPHAPWMPILQGWTLADYLRCAEMYAAAGVDLTDQAVVGLGSVCRRQASGEIALITSTLARLGIRLHGFGVKTDGLRLYGHHLASFDSMAWSDVARKHRVRLPGCTHTSIYCNNCLVWALVWREKILAKLHEPIQDSLALDFACAA
jgi:hypothetical protein